MIPFKSVAFLWSKNTITYVDSAIWNSQVKKLECRCYTASGSEAASDCWEHEI